MFYFCPFAPLRYSPAFFAASCAVLLFWSVPQVSCAQAVVPNALTAVEGATSQSTLGMNLARTYQMHIAASQLTGFATGSQILGLSLRLDNAASATDLTFASYQVTLSQATNAIGSFSNTFGNNIGANSEPMRRPFTTAI